MANRSWTMDDERYLRHQYGYLPISQVAKNLGRTRYAVEIRARRVLGLLSIDRRPELMTVMEFGKAMGIGRSAANALVEGKRFSVTMYQGNVPQTMVVIDEFIPWLRDPLNWKDLDEFRIQDPRFCSIVENAIGNRLDRWLSIPEAAKRAGYSIYGMARIVNERQIKASKGTRGVAGNRKWLIRQSDLDWFIERRNNPDDPDYPIECDNGEKWLTVKQVGTYCGYSKGGVHKLIRKGHLPAEKNPPGLNGRPRLYVRVEDVETFLERLNRSPHNNGMLSVEQAAAYCGYCTSTIYEFIRNGELKARKYKVGPSHKTKLVVNKSDLDAFMENGHQ